MLTIIAIWFGIYVTLPLVLGSDRQRQDTLLGLLMSGVLLLIAVGAASLFGFRPWEVWH